MERFAALVARLEAAREEATAATLLADYLARTPDPDRGAALGLLLGTAPTRRAGRGALARLAERLDPELLAISREVVGDLGETVALMWPTPAGDPPGVSEIAEGLAALERNADAQAATLAGWLDRLAPAARVALLRLATGQLAGLVSVRVAQAALARLGTAPLAEIEALWHAADPTYTALLSWAESRGPRPAPALVAAFRPLACVRALGSQDDASLDLAAHAADFAWDGLRVLAVAEGGARRLYSRRGEDMSARFPELVEALAFNDETRGAVEGVVLARDAEGRWSRTALEARLGSRARLRGGETTLMLHDALALGGEDLTALPFRARRARLEAFAAELSAARLALGPLMSATDWAGVERLRAEARAAGAAGLVLKPWEAAYAAGDWLETGCAPLQLRAVVLYLEHGADALRATLGVWRGDELVPVGKAALIEPAHVEAIAAAPRVDRFGPVVQLEAHARAGVVVGVACAAVDAAPRRKAGLVLREPQIIRVVEDAGPKEAATLEEVRGLMAPPLSS